MTFSYLPVNIGYAAGPAIGILVTQLDIFGIFPAAAVLTALGIGVLAVAARQQVPLPVKVSAR